MRFTAGLPPAQAREAVSSLNLSRSSPFGPLSQPASRRTFAYLIGTLNASHPDYDFSHLRPSDFRREKSLNLVMNTLDTTLYNLRPQRQHTWLGVSRHWSARVDPAFSLPSRGHEAWDSRMWRLIDKEMSLKECSVYSYAPIDDSFDGEEGAIWSFNYFFFNKVRKRVCYFYLRGLSILSHSPVETSPIYFKRKADGDWSPVEPSSSKRAKYWLGDRAGETFSSQWAEDEEDDVIQPWENEGLNTTYLTDDDDIPRYLFASDEDEQPQLMKQLRTDSAVISESETIQPSPRNRSKSVVREIRENNTDPVVI